MKKKEKPTTYADLVSIHGSQEAAAAVCGVTLSTFGRWMRGKNHPRGKLVKDRLRELGVEVAA